MFVETQETTPSDAAHDARIKLIEEVIAEIRPNLKRDGGDCEFLGLEGKRIMVRLTGACVLCKLSSATLEGIQTKLVERLGELVRVVPVMPGVKLGH